MSMAVKKEGIKMMQLRIFGVFALVALAAVFGGERAWAWGDLGHETVGQIAEANLSDHAKSAVLDILGPELLAIAATWPDAVRDDSDFDGFKPYHFVEIPTGKSYEAMSSDEHSDKDAYTVLSKFSLVLKGKAGRTQKMIALRYLVHVVGDVHQPLHVGNGADRGGNLCEVYWSEASQKSKRSKNLHSVWDGSLVDAVADDFHTVKDHAIFEATGKEKSTYYGFRDLSKDLLAEANLSAEDIKKIQSSGPLDWIKESQGLRAQVYPDGGQKVSDDRSRLYCKYTTAGDQIDGSKFDAEKVPLLDDVYKKTAKQIVKTQLLHGGLRLAGMLNTIFARYPIRPPSKVDLIKSFELTNPGK
jgi:hypothetical protein